MMQVWEEKALGDVCDVIGGGTPSKKNSKFYGGSIPWATVRDMRSDIITKTEHSITKEAVKESSTNIIPAHNVIIATRVGLGKVCFIEQETAINQDLRGVMPKNINKLNVNFLCWWFKSISHKIIAEGTGATVQGVKLPFVKSLLIPLPPLEEQKRIVEILDEAFAGIDQAIENTEKNLINARELFESYLNNIFTQKGDGWVDAPISTITTVINGHSFKSGDFSSENPVKAIKITNVGVKQFVDDDQNNLPSSFRERFPKKLVYEEDVVVALTRTLIAGGLKVARVPKHYDGSLLNQRVAALRPDRTKILNDFLYHFFCTDHVLQYVKNHVNELMQPNLSIKDLESLLVPIPSIDKQRTLVNKINEFSLQNKILETTYQQKLTVLKELKQSLLKKAFSGELTSNMREAA